MKKRTLTFSSPLKKCGYPTCHSRAGGNPEQRTPFGYGLLVVIALATLTLTGCVERLITVTSNPPGAIVWLNGQEIGATPATVPFTWYGTYEVLLRRQGYRTIRTARRADPPVYQWLGLDLIFECFLPVNLVDRHQWDFPMTAHTPTDPNALLQRARTLRAQLLTP